MAILKKLVVKTGTYEKGGKTVGRYETIGHLHEGEHGEYVTLKACMNLAAFPRKDGDDRVMVNLFDNDEKSSRETAARGVASARAAVQPSFDDDEPAF